MKAFLILEDGTIYTGTHIGAEKEVICEIVFNTSMAGYLEELTDPSYAGQAVCMTYPLIGNYGICMEDAESRRAWPEGIIVRELSRMASNFRKEISIQDYLKSQGVTGIAGIDTRALTKILRTKGTMNGMITINENINLNEILPRLKAYQNKNAVPAVTCDHVYEVKGTEVLEANGPIAGSSRFMEADYQAGIREKQPSHIYKLNGKGFLVAILDVGMRNNIIQSLTHRGCDVTVYPADTTAAKILAADPDGIMISNGPGDPKDCPEIIRQVKLLYDSQVPIFAVGLGHQLMALATGGDTCKMKYGHRGGNLPVKDLATGRVYISSQNHGYVVDADKLNPSVAVPAFVNVNDGTSEGLQYTGKSIITVQFHPEACPGSLDSRNLFDRFIKMMEERKNA